MVYGETIAVKTKGYSESIDITDSVSEIVKESQIKNGMALISVIGSKASISTIEYEPALVADMKDHLERIASRKEPTRHGDTWGDDNGFSHIRATVMGPSLVVPLSAGALVLGTWQQVVVIDHDNRPRDRKIFVQIMGE